MREAFAYETTAAQPLPEAYWLLNVADDPTMTGGKPDGRAFNYRKLGNRSLSVGDVVSFEGTVYAVANTGWKELGSLSRFLDLPTVTELPVVYFSAEATGDDWGYREENVWRPRGRG